MVEIANRYQAPDAVSIAEALSYFDSYLGFQRRLLRLPGLQAAAFAHGSIAMSTAHGLADVEHGIELTPAHLFRVASHSKTFTATVVMQLAEEGVLRLDDTASRWLDFLDDTELAKVTVRHLLAHSAGVIRDGYDGDFWQGQGRFPDQGRLRAMLLEPGAAVLPRDARFKYSNIGYSLLGLILEEASGLSYDQLVQIKIVEPLGLADTGMDVEGDRLADYVVGYSALAYADARVPMDLGETGAIAPAAGVYSNAEDLVTFFSGHFLGDDRLLSDAAKREMQHPLWEANDQGRRYGLGLMINDVAGRKVMGHRGGWPGQFTGSVADTAAGIAVTVLTNAADGPAEELALTGMKLIDLAGAEPRPDQPIEPSRFTGRFMNWWGVVDVALLGGRLYSLTPTAPDPTSTAVPLEIVDDSTLRFAGGFDGSYGEPMTFAFDADGRVTSMRGLIGTTHVPLESFTLPDRFHTSY
jgi:CubicO group peptidase (beta-lactamase class C family)